MSDILLCLRSTRLYLPRKVVLSRAVLRLTFNFLGDRMRFEYCAQYSLVLDWWKSRIADFPNLAPIAIAYLLFPKSSCQAERTFSLLGHDSYGA